MFGEYDCHLSQICSVGVWRNPPLVIFRHGTWMNYKYRLRDKGQSGMRINTIQTLWRRISDLVGGGTNRHKGIMWRVQLNKRTICTSTAWWVYFMHFLLMMLLYPFFHIWASTVCTHLLRSMSATSARACKRLGSSCWCWELELYAVASI